MIQNDFDLAKAEVEFCIKKAINWYFGYNLLGITESILKSKENVKLERCIDENGNNIDYWKEEIILST